VTEAVRRSDATRAAILAAARDRFAVDGYDRATIRAIAADAHIDPAMVMRYYGNKEKLFAAAADFDLALPDLTGQPVTEYGELLVRHFLRRWESNGTFLALLRGAVTAEPARDRLREILARQLAPAFARLCPYPGEAPARAGLAATQMLGLALCRYILALPPVATMLPDDLAHWIGPVIQRYLRDDR
jgi:AcrR family transcriptional regulator